MSDLVKREHAMRVAMWFGRSKEQYPFSFIKKRVMEIPTADRPQGKWIDEGRNLWGCSNCGMEIYSESERDRNEFHKWCSRCGARMKGADDE